jgi:hypothetical protein
MQKPIRLKEVRRQEQRTTAVKNLMEMFHLDRNGNGNQYEYQTMGASSSSALDPKTAKIKELFHMFNLDR